MAISATSIQEAAMAFANSITASLNSAAADAMGIEVMWFRLIPDKRNQDVIFQSYTLFGVEDCPLTFNVMYSDSGYDDAAITYNIMGLEYSVPLTLDIPAQTWYNVTENDGTLPQRGDIVFIPLSNKLVEVVSMTPVKAIAAQITSYKVNCSIYKPTRSRYVGENLKTSIENNTVNLKSRFGKDIIDTFENVVDDKQTSGFSSTSEDAYKEVTKYSTVDTLLTDRKVRNIVSYDLEVDGHVVARTYYDMNQKVYPIVKYIDIKDNFTENDVRCYTAWFKLNEFPSFKNIKSISTIQENGKSYINILEYSGKRHKPGTNVVIERGNIVLSGVISDTVDYKVEVNNLVFNGLKRAIPNWYNLQGFIMREDNVINFLNGTTEDGKKFKIDLKADNYIAVTVNDEEKLIQMPVKLKEERWYGITINYGSTFAVDIFESTPELKKVGGVDNVKNKLDIFGKFTDYFIDPSACCLTNIRLFNSNIYDLDKQIANLISYNTPANAGAIINDSADTYLDKVYIGYDG